MHFIFNTAIIFTDLASLLLNSLHEAFHLALFISSDPAKVFLQTIIFFLVTVALINRYLRPYDMNTGSGDEENQIT